VTKNLLAAEHISKSYGKIPALQGVSFSIQAGDIFGLAGDNGAGKSTLVKILHGDIQPDSGQYTIEGNIQKFKKPADAMKQRIGMLYQDHLPVQGITVLEELALRSGPFFHTETAMTRFKNTIFQIQEQYSLELELEKKTSQLKFGEVVFLQLLSLILQKPKILLADEPSSGLSKSDAQQVRNVLTQLASEGLAIIWISHNPLELEHWISRGIFLREGRVFRSWESSEEFKTQVEPLFPAELKSTLPRETSTKPPLLSITNVCGRGYLHNFSLDARGGEVIGIYSQQDSTLSELESLLCGLEDPEKGTIVFEGNTLRSAKTWQRRALGWSFVPSKREQFGFAMNYPLEVSLTTFSGNPSAKNLDRQIGPEIMQRIHEPVYNFSGGNKQRILMYRELTKDAKVKIVAEPVKGLDAQKRKEIFTLIEKTKNPAGIIILLARDKADLIPICSRILELDLDSEQEEKEGNDKQ
jgi:ABC-type sugar transport system ATPase subunit